MLAIGASNLSYPELDVLASHNEVALYVSDEDPVALERDANAWGTLYRSLPDWRGGHVLAGIHLSGAGKGLRFTVAMFMNRTGANLGTFNPNPEGDGLRLFFWKGETPQAFMAEYAKVQQRIEAWAPGGTHTREMRAWELAGASNGLQFMGCVLVYRQEIPD